MRSELEGQEPVILDRDCKTLDLRQDTPLRFCPDLFFWSSDPPLFHLLEQLWFRKATQHIETRKRKTPALQLQMLILF